MARALRTSHGLSGTRTYLSWQAAKERCHNPANPNFVNYGGRGIVVCERWRHSFEAFLADMGPRPAHTSLDRIDNGGGYAPGNCRWATKREQNNNTSSNRVLAHGGQSQTIAQWAAQTGLHPRALAHRIRRGWTVERALTTPVHR